MALLSIICFHLYFHPVVQNFQKKMTLLPVSTQALASQSKLVFLQKSEKIPHNFGVYGQHTAELGKNVLGPLKCFIASDT